MVWTGSVCKSEEKKELMQEVPVSPKVAAHWMGVLEGGRNEK